MTPRILVVSKALTKKLSWISASGLSDGENGFRRESKELKSGSENEIFVPHETAGVDTGVRSREI